MKKVLLLWYMEEENYGDVLIYETARQYLGEKYVIECHEVGDGVMQIASHASQCDFMLFAGGGIIERYLPPIIRGIQEFTQNCNIKYGVMGLSVGEFDYSEYQQPIKHWVENAEFFYVRDKETERILQTLSGNKKVRYTADCVFANEKIELFTNQKNISHGINVRNMPYIDLTGDLDWEYIREIKEKYKLNRIIPDASKDMESIFTGGESSRFMRQFYQMTREEKINFITEQIAGCDYIFAMRFHVVLVAALLGIPTISVKYCPKVTMLVEQLGLEELAMNANEIQLFELKKKYLDENKDEIEKKLKANVNKMVARAKEMYQLVIVQISNIMEEEK